MANEIPLDPNARADDPNRDARRNDGTHEVAPDVAYRRLAIVNAVFFGPSGAGDRNWVLIDAGVYGTTGWILDAAEERFGKEARPAAIILTHGHADHVGGLNELAERWDAPVYAHELEGPYLDGRAAYPPPDPTVGGGLMAALSPLFSPEPVDVIRRLHFLPANGSVPFMPGWEWVHTPGHTPGHVSLWRERDRCLIAGDAFITTDQESAYAVLVQKPLLQGPPMYYTQNWPAARASVQHLAGLEPEIAVTGHGPAMRGAELRAGLHALAQDFDRLAVPREGEYVTHPAAVADGSAYRPPRGGRAA